MNDVYLPADDEIEDYNDGRWDEPDPEEEWLEQHGSRTEVDLVEAEPGGRVFGTVYTNDNYDRGYGGYEEGYADWPVSYKDKESALKYWGGGSHRGFAGSFVIVRFNGMEV